MRLWAIENIGLAHTIVSTSKLHLLHKNRMSKGFAFIQRFNEVRFSGTGKQVPGAQDCLVTSSKSPYNLNVILKFNGSPQPLENAGID